MKKFWNLSVSQRRKVCAQCGLLDDHSETMSEPERYLRAFNYARQVGKYDDLVETIENTFLATEG